MSYSLKEFQSIKMYHRADQGPCPRGFHIGSKDEWQSLINYLTALGAYNVSDITTVLNIPSAYYLTRTNGSLETRYGIARYWTSTMTSNTVAWAWGIDQNPTIVFQEDKPGNAFSIRPFKDEPVIPDSSWTESPYGVFKNTTLGLISIQNASNWITISDKNLGATNVGDKGLYYQFGNNHGFTVNPTSYYTSKVSNTQAYGPSNYYNDDHFVRVSSGNNWFTDTNNNIRGGVDTTSLYPTEAKEVWLGNHKVRPASRLPSAYQEVEYIQSSGTQYINTGVTAPTNYLKTYMKINPQTVSTGSQDYRAGGAYNGSRANVHYFGYGQYKLYAGFGGGDYNTGIGLSANTLYEVTMTANNGSYSVTVNNSTVTGTYSGSVAIDKAFFLFRNNENGSAGAGGTFKIYSFQMTTSNGLVRDFVPCYRKSDSVIGMYDLVTNTFYTNAGSGTFIKGGDV